MYKLMVLEGLNAERLGALSFLPTDGRVPVAGGPVLVAPFSAVYTVIFQIYIDIYTVFT